MKTLTDMPKYEAYKDSGVDWLGEIPNDWALVALNRAVVNCVNGLWGNEPNNLNDIVVLRVADFDRNKLKIDDSKLTLRSIPVKDRNGRLLKKGDLLIEKSGGGDKTLVGCVVLFDKDYEAVTSNFVAKMTPKNNFESRFLCYVFSFLYSSDINYRSIKQTTGIQNLDSSAYLSEVAAFPSLKIQTAIANFLDEKTAKIDEAIAIKEKQIELLKERKQIIIQQAVTQGLDPTVPMKDSGVEWIGKIPVHWEMKPLKLHLKKIIDNRGRTPAFGDNGIPMLEVKNITDGDLYPTEQFDKFVIPSVVEKYERDKVAIGDVLISTVGATSGKTVLIKNSPTYFICQNVVGLRPDIDLGSEFLNYTLSAVYFKTSLQMINKGNTIDNLKVSVFINNTIVMPPLQEQEKIAAHIELESRKTNNAIDIFINQINKLKEYKTTLINSAVTGKIKVV